MKAPPIRDCMTGHPLTIDLYEPVSVAEKIINSKGIHHLPVVDGKKAYGIISDRDIAIARRAYPKGAFDGEVLVRDLCLSDLFTAGEDEPLDKVTKRMYKNKQDAVLVVRDGKPVGIFTTTDACRFISEIFKEGASGGLWAKLLGE